jgi:hypothetical protein
MAMKPAGLSVLLVCLGCGSSALPTEVAPPTSEHPVIGQLRTRDRRITLLAARDGLRVTVEDSTGAQLARDVAVEELKARDPAAYDLFRTSVASRGEPLDARLDLPRPTADLK